MKTKEELNAIKKEIEELNRKLTELTEDELAAVAGGSADWRTHNGVDLGYKTEQARLDAWDLIFKA